MKNLAAFTLAALILSGIVSAQSLPPIDVFGGASYMDFVQPATGETDNEKLIMYGWDVSGAVAVFHRLSVEADFSHHSVTNCGGVSVVNCKDFSYMFGPRFTFGDRSRRMTLFVHGLGGRDQATLLFLSGLSGSDTSLAFAAGAGIDYWVFRHIGLQLGPADFVYTNHLNDNGASGQGSFRASAGITFRIGGEFPEREPKAPKPAKARKAKSEGGHRSWIRPWHKSKPSPPPAPEEGQPEGQAPETKPAPAPAPQPAPAPPSAPSAPSPAPAPSRGMEIHPLGIVVAPQEFQGAKILQIEPGSVAEMASLHVGDLVKAVNGKPVRTPMELAAKLADRTGKVRIRIQRNGKKVNTVVVLGNR